MPSNPIALKLCEKPYAYLQNVFAFMCYFHANHTKVQSHLRGQL